MSWNLGGVGTWGFLLLYAISLGNMVRYTVSSYVCFSFFSFLNLKMDIVKRRNM